MSAKLTHRREFLATASGTAVVLGTGVGMARAAAGANDRLSIGIIGTGGRGSYLMGRILGLADSHNVRVTALCDVWRVNLDKAAGQVEKTLGKKPRTFTRFGDLLALDDVDAVMIATPDFGHTPIMIQALKAGKDVYVEKPMSQEIKAADEAFRLTQENGRIVQVGTQRRSEGKYKAIFRTLSAGTIGHISRISASVDFNQARWLRAYDDCKAKDVDWDAYLFNRPAQPFDPKLLRRWHLYKTCTNGLSGLWMSHFADAVNIIMGSTYPTSAVAHGGTYVWKENREHCDTFHALLDYPEGFLFNWSMGLANSAGGHFTVHGTQGTLDVDKMTYSGAGGPGGKEPIPTTKVTGARPNENHQANWIECLRSRKRPNASIDYGHRHAVATIMTAAALHTGQRQIYDPKTSTLRAGSRSWHAANK